VRSKNVRSCSVSSFAVKRQWASTNVLGLDLIEELESSGIIKSGRMRDGGWLRATDRSRCDGGMSQSFRA
jgi:hypothetical protein